MHAMSDLRMRFFGVLLISVGVSTCIRMRSASSGADLRVRFFRSGSEKIEFGCKFALVSNIELDRC